MMPAVGTGAPDMPQNLLERNGALISAMREEFFVRQGGGWFRIVSGSMAPLIAIEDRVYARHVLPREIRVGDIVVFKNGSIFVTHRVIGLLRNGAGTLVLQKGDAGSAADTVDIRSVIGKVELIEKNGKRVRLDHGFGRAINAFLAFCNCSGYRLRIAGRWIGVLSAGAYLRGAHRVSGRIFALLHRMLVHRLLG